MLIRTFFEPLFFVLLKNKQKKFNVSPKISFVLSFVLIEVTREYLRGCRGGRRIFSRWLHHDVGSHRVLRGRRKRRRRYTSRGHGCDDAMSTTIPEAHERVLGQLVRHRRTESRRFRSDKLRQQWILVRQPESPGGTDERRDTDVAVRTRSQQTSPRLPAGRGE